jgi:enoyl-CoA hydratase
MMDTGDPRIQLAVEGQVAVITVARPEKLNALDFPMVQALEKAAQAVDADAGIRAAIITGAGGKSFCAGGDVEAWSAIPPEAFAFTWVRMGHRAFDALARMRPPFIAALNGHTLGGGLELAATADIRIAERHIKIGLPETGIGIIPGWSGTQRAVRRFGAQAVRRMSLAGEIFTAEQALALGLVDQVVDQGESLNAARAVAERIAARGPKATALAKLMINAAEGEEREAAMEIIAGHVAAESADLKEGIRAFQEKRRPEF